MFLNFADFMKENKTAIMIIMMILFFVGLIVLSFVYFFKSFKKKKRGEKIRHMTSIAIFATLSIIFYLTLKFSLPIFPSFLKINFSNLPILLGGFLLGPVEGMIIILIRTVAVIPFSGTFYVGELADLIISSAVLLISSIIYVKHKTRKGALVSLAFAALTWIVVGCVANYLILVPAYITLFFGGNVNVFVSMLEMIPGVNESNYNIRYVLFGALPFNALLSLGVSIITYLVYKRMSNLFHLFDKKIYKEELENEENDVKKVA